MWTKQNLPLCILLCVDKAERSIGFLFTAVCRQSRTLPCVFCCVWTKQNPHLLCILLCVDKTERSLGFLFTVVCGQSSTLPCCVFCCVWKKQYPPLCVLPCVDKAEPSLVYFAVCGQSRTLPWLPLYSCVWTKRNPPWASSLQLCVDKAEPFMGFLFTTVCGLSIARLEDLETLLTK